MRVKEKMRTKCFARNKLAAKGMLCTSPMLEGLLCSAARIESIPELCRTWHVEFQPVCQYCIKPIVMDWHSSPLDLIQIALSNCFWWVNVTEPRFNFWLEASDSKHRIWSQNGSRFVCVLAYLCNSSSPSFFYAFFTQGLTTHDSKWQILRTKDMKILLS